MKYKDLWKTTLRYFRTRGAIRGELESKEAFSQPVCDKCGDEASGQCTLCDWLLCVQCAIVHVHDVKPGAHPGLPFKEADGSSGLGYSLQVAEEVDDNHAYGG